MEQSSSKSGHVDTDERPPQVPVNSDYWDGYVDERGAAEFLGFSVAFFQNLRYRGGGPPYSKIGRQVRYRRRDIEAWAAERVRTSTADPGAAAA